MNSYKHPLRVGVGGPVGSGKTTSIPKKISASSPKRARWRLNASSVWKPAAARIRRSAKMPQ
mgnify:CR=1 FL=1